MNRRNKSIDQRMSPRESSLYLLGDVDVLPQCRLQGRFPLQEGLKASVLALNALQLFKPLPCRTKSQ